MDHRLNIIYFVCHDLGKQLGCYDAGIETPHLNRLASEGMVFNRAYTNAIACSPSRGCVMTGQYSHTNGLMGLVNRGWSLPVDRRTIVDDLNAAGYVTVNCGIQHERHRREDNRYSEVRQHRHIEDAVGEAIAFLQDRQGEDRPFYLNIATVETHPSQWCSIRERSAVYESWQPDEVYIPPFVPDTPQTRKELASFQGCIRYMDHHIGSLLEAIDRLGYRKNTVVVFTNDHGVAAPRAKPTIYETGSGISLIVRAPGGVSGTCNHLVQNIDYTPTLLDLAGIDKPDRLQGNSFAPLLFGDSYEPHQEVFLERNYHSGTPSGEPLSTDQPNAYFDPMRAVRTERYRYIRHCADRPLRYWFPDEVRDRMGTEYHTVWNYLWPPLTEPRDREELFDLDRDPNERQNLAADPEYASILSDLSARVDRWMTETNDPLLNGEIPDRLYPWEDA